MARIKKKRLVQMAPCFGGFKPFGVLNEKQGRVMINIEEYEALKLCGRSNHKSHSLAHD